MGEILGGGGGGYNDGDDGWMRMRGLCVLLYMLICS